MIHVPVTDPNDFWSGNTFGAAFMYRREVAERVGDYDPDLALVEDYDFFLRLSYCATVHHLPDVVYEYLDHGDSLTHVRSEHQIRALESPSVITFQVPCWEEVTDCRLPVKSL